MKHFKNEFKCFPKERHEVDAYSTTKKLMTRSLFVALTVMAVLLWSHVGSNQLNEFNESSSPTGGYSHTRSVLDNVKDIWNSPDRLTAIENEINERLSLVTLDENRIVTSASE